METYKKWIVIVTVVIVAGIFFVTYMSRQPVQTDRPVRETARQSPMPPGPLIDQDLSTVVPVEELGVDSDNPQSLASLGDQYFEKKQFEQAIEIYKKVLELNPGDADTYNDLGLAYQYTKRVDLAVEALSKGIEANPSFQRIRLSLGFVLMMADKKEEAKIELRKAADLDPQTEVGQEALRMLGFLKQN